MALDLTALWQSSNVWADGVNLCIYGLLKEDNHNRIKSTQERGGTVRLIKQKNCFQTSERAYL